MKISKLHIDSFRHLENLEFDFTYQSGERKGEPLDKICFIGQSATGKTSLLELINKDINGFFKTELDDVGDIWIRSHKFDSNFKLINNNQSFEYDNGVISKNDKSLSFSKKSASFIQYLFEKTDRIFHITSDILSNQNIKLFEEETVLLIERFKTLSKERELENEYSRLTFDHQVEEEVWISLLKQNVKYLQDFLQFATELINSGSVLDNSSQKKVDDWKSKNSNPLTDFSEKFDVILNKVQLEVDLVNTKNIIPLKHKITGENIPIKNISTGTKQLLLTAFPLFKLETNNSIILIDEPERSLYPDMQMDLMDYYKNLAPEAQFIVSTHSPFIAASFEPDERFILYFDEEGKVAVRRGTSPIGDDPNDMLYNDFGIDYINKYGKKVYNEYLEKRRQLLFEENEEVKKKLQDEIESIGDKYNF
ncbi:AAA family ATPase [Flavobacterium sp. DG2-3]|uniref:AAA family ATPase n=1 Tax=Flavobacterium sp. DG2-3 TaxID=3068317 RepID=UPI00273D2925|nr:ATP-binding protein [Flavobacterium sp. DG2-3]MDP5200807.1 AAA family ATPase [Flavobacterium sp. DG2-3]